MRESVKIILQCIERLLKDQLNQLMERYSTNRDDLKQSMEALIHHLNYLPKGTVPKGDVYIARAS